MSQYENEVEAKRVINMMEDIQQLFAGCPKRTCVAAMVSLLAGVVGEMAREEDGNAIAFAEGYSKILMNAASGNVVRLHPNQGEKECSTTESSLLRRLATRGIMWLLNLGVAIGIVSIVENELPDQNPR